MKIKLLVLFWLNMDNYLDVIVDESDRTENQYNIVKQWAEEHDYNSESIVFIEKELEI